MARRAAKSRKKNKTEAVSPPTPPPAVPEPSEPSEPPAPARIVAAEEVQPTPAYFAQMAARLVVNAARLTLGGSDEDIENARKRAMQAARRAVRSLQAMQDS